MKRNLLLAFLGATLLVLASCNKGGKTGLKVPKDAAFVLNINLESLSSKLSWEEIKSTDWFKELGTQPEDSLSRQLLANPESSGLDTKSNHAIFMKMEGRKAYIAITGKLKDAAAYEKMLTGLSKETKVSKEGSISIANNSEGSVVLWNNDTYIGLFASPDYFANDFQDYNEYNENRRKISTDSLKQIGIKVLGLSGDDLLDSDKRFADLINQSGDMHLWTNAGKFSNASTFGMTSLMKSSLLIENTVSTGVLNFENGKIDVKTKTYYGKEVTDLLKKYEPKNVSDEVINRLPASENVVMAGVFNYPPEGLKALLVLTGVDGMANGFLGEANYSVDEFIKANKGDLAFAISGFNMKVDSVAYEGLNGKTEYFPRRQPEIEFVAGVSVNDKEAFNKLIGIVAKEMNKSDNANPKVSYKLEDNWFALGNSEANVSSFLAGKNKPPYASKISGHMGGGFLDIQRALRIASEQFGNSPGNEDNGDKALQLSIAFWKDAITFGDVKDGVAVMNFEVNLVDQSTNSLKQLNNYFNELSKLRPKREKYSPEDGMVEPPAAVELDTIKPLN